MFDERKERQLDQVLHALLSEYSAQAPRPGLEGRILAGLRARAARRRRTWTLTLAAPTAAALLIAVVMSSRKPILLPSHDPSPATPTVASNRSATVAPSLERSGPQIHEIRRTKEPSNPPSLLQVVDAMHRESSLVFEHEKLYLDPAPQPSPKLGGEQEAAAPGISIQDLGVKPIAIKELTPEKETDEEGKL
jgi:hypothetical protein